MEKSDQMLQRYLSKLRQHQSSVVHIQVKTTCPTLISHIKSNASVNHAQYHVVNAVHKSTQRTFSAGQRGEAVVVLLHLQRRLLLCAVAVHRAAHLLGLQFGLGNQAALAEGWVVGALDELVLLLGDHGADLRVGKR
jgi:hypothetical protein